MLSSFASAIQILRPYFFPALIQQGADQDPSSFHSLLQVEDYGFGWMIQNESVAASEGFGPVSQLREVDFTVEFENTVLLLLPNALLLIFVVWSTAQKRPFVKRYPSINGSSKRTVEVTNEKQDAAVATSSLAIHQNRDEPTIDSDFQVLLPVDNGLLRYRILLYGKISVALTCAASLAVAAGLTSVSNAGESNIFGCILSAIGYLLGAFSSWRQHRSTWRPSAILQCYLMLMLVMVAIRTRTEWTRTDRLNDELAAVLSVNLGQLLLWLILESIPRMTSSRVTLLELPPDMTANIFSLMVCQYVQPLISKGYRYHRKNMDMDVECLFQLRPTLLSRRLGHALLSNWRKQTRNYGQGKILTSIFTLYAPNVIIPIGLYLLYTASQFASPLLLNGFLNWLSTFDTPLPGPLRIGLEYAFGMFGMTVIVSVLFIVSVLYVNQTLMAFRGALMSAVYQKALRLSPEEFNKRSIGDISNHISVDAESLLDGDLALVSMVGLPFTMILAIYFLYQQLSWAVFPGLGWYILVIFTLQSPLGRRFGRAMKYRLEHMDKRVSVVNESVSGIKFVKLNAWEKPFMARIFEKRDEELKGLLKRAKAFSGMLVSTQLNKNGTPLIMFWVYEMVIAKNGTSLNANKIFVSLVVTNIITVALEMLTFSLSWVYTVIASMKRVQKFLNADELVVEQDEQVTLEMIVQSMPSEKDTRKPVIAFRNTLFTWVKDIEQAKFKLKVPYLTIEENEFLAVVGRVGAGKSSFLSAILEVMYRQDGGIYMDKAPIAYCAQSTFIMNASLQDNILFGQSFDNDKLDKVIRACALDVDIDMLPGGLNTEIGERGIGLSGGQKARVALARACYAVLTGYANIVMLDDVLSAVDVHTERHLFRHVLSNETGILRNTTRILVTHAVHYMDKVDRILYLADGEAVQLGTHIDLMSTEGMYRSLINDFAKTDKLHGRDSVSEADQVDLSEKKKIPGNGKEKSALTSEEEMKTGRVSWRVYARFIVAGGILNFCLTEGLLAFHRAIWYVGYYWLSDWLALPNPTHTPAFYLGIYTLFQFLATITQPYGFYLGQSRFGIRASKSLFSQMVTKVFRAPMSFFDTTPTGRVLNRLTSDMNQIDAGLTDKLFATLAQFNQVAASLIAAGVATPYLFVMLPPLAVLYYFIMEFYQATARGLRRLDAGRTRSPLYQHISHTLEGMETVKAYGLTANWLEEFHARVDLNQRAKRMEFILLGWMMIRLEFLGAILILACSIFAVVARNTISTSVVGLAVSTLMNVVAFLSVLVNTFSMMEVDAVHAERVLQYTELPSEAPLDLPTDVKHEMWPQEGTVVFDNFSARYRKDLPLTLKNVTVKFAGGSKVAIVGRTGSGKSTLTLALFRLIEGISFKPMDRTSDVDMIESVEDLEKGEADVEHAGGSISIDGVNIAELGLAKLRSAIAIIPQDATMFGGTLRTNLSPFGDHLDADLWHALEAAGLKDHVNQNMHGGLDAEIQSGGANLSKGQLQQVGLARAMLRKAQILILDEATSSMDLETDALIQRAIREHFSTCTVITIAHRIATILDSDSVLVMDYGRVAEFGEPNALLANPHSLFAKLATETGQAKA